MSLNDVWTANHSSVNDNSAVGFSHTQFAPFDPDVKLYISWGKAYSNLQLPYEYEGWMKETMSWKKNCYLNTSLSDICCAARIKGPDAEKMLSDMCVNNFSIDRFPVGKAKHIIHCSERGNISSHGMCLRMAEDEFITYFVDRPVRQYSTSGKYNVEPVVFDYTKDFVFQLAGPKSLEIVENVIKQDIHDLKFMQFMPGKVLGFDVRVLRMGMGGSLSYEIHGDTDHIFEIYNEIMRVGEPYGITKLGILQYMSNHTENGFPQVTEHFMADNGEDFVKVGADPLLGSLADLGKTAYYLNPIEAGWSKMINWNHDFTGKEALEKINNDPRTRKVVTLEWNKEDILKVFGMYFDDEEGEITQMRIPQDYEDNRSGNIADKVVDKDGNLIGKSTGRVYTLYYKRMISMAFIDPEYANEGDAVTIIWGNPGTRQIPIRATVARYPYLALPRNDEFDIESIPHYQG